MQCRVRQISCPWRDENTHNNQKSKSTTVTPASIADWNGLQAMRCVAFCVSVWWEQEGTAVEKFEFVLF
ncbi:hypothetical protein ACH3XW_8245 [Acanthocheilonema viteae]